MQLAVYHDCATSEKFTESIQNEKLLERLKALLSKANRKGLDALDPSRNRLIRIGMEVDGNNRVEKSGYGVLELSWQSQHHREWANRITAEAAKMRREIESQNQTKLRFLIIAGSDLLFEQKPRLRSYTLDSNSPSKLDSIVKDMQRISRRDIDSTLKSALAIGVSRGPIETVADFYATHSICAQTNLLCAGSPQSAIAAFAASRKLRCIQPQLDGQDSTAEHHAAPLTRAALYATAFSGADLESWIAATQLTNEEIETAWRAAAILRAHAVEGRDKLTLLLPKEWSTAAQWTRRNFEKSLGRNVVIDEKVKLPNYHAPKDSKQDRLFFAIQVKGLAGPGAKTLALLRHRGYPLVVLTFPQGAILSRFLQFIHYVVFGEAWLMDMNFTKPKRVAQPRERQTAAIKWRGGITLRYAGSQLSRSIKTAPEIYAALINETAPTYASLRFDGDTRYSMRGRSIKTILQRSAETLFRKRLRIAAGIDDESALVSGIFSTAITTIDAPTSALPTIVLKDLEPATLTALDEFFRQAAKHVTL